MFLEFFLETCSIFRGNLTLVHLLSDFPSSFYLDQRSRAGTARVGEHWDNGGNGRSIKDRQSATSNKFW